MSLPRQRATAFAATALIAAAGLAGTGHAAVQCAGVSAHGLYACKVDPALHPNALCIDGTSPVFFYRPGRGSGASTWLIWLQGGDGWCFDMPSCTVKGTDPHYARQLTSNGVRSVAPEGLLSPDPAVNPGLYNVNNVFVHYCSSDFWSGSHRASAPFDTADPATWNFEGRNNALAAVASLKEMSAAFSGAQEVLFGGDSAGGIGAALLANDVMPMLPPAARLGIILDTGFTIDAAAYDAARPATYVSTATPTPFERVWSSGLALWNGHGDSRCEARAVTQQDHVRCATTSSILNAGYIAAPVFVAQSQLDKPQIALPLCPQEYGKCGVSTQPTSPKGRFADSFGRQMARTLATGGGALYSVFSPDQYMHIVLAKDAPFAAAYAFPTGPAAARDALYSWLAQLPGTPRMQISSSPGVGSATP